MLRENLFILKEKISGNKILKNIKELESGSKKSQVSKFNELLSHAKNTTKHYENYSLNQSLNEYPIISKNVIKENYNDFLSNSYKIEQLYKMTTSGSYGTPFTFYLTSEKKDKQRAEILYYGEWANYKVGKKHAYLMTKSKSKLKLFLQNEIIMAPFTLDIKWLNTQKRVLDEEKPLVLIGYTSAIATLAKYVISEGKQYNLDGVICVSEVLTESYRKTIRKAFKVNALSRYSTQEFGVLANECPEKLKHHLNDVNYIIEVLNINNDSPALPGELGRIVVTDLFSHAMPLIRYDTGDLGIMSEKQCECGRTSPVLDKIEGRLIEEIFNTDGDVVSGFAINGAMQDIENILQYQFSQESEKEYTVRIIKLKGYKEEKLIEDRFKKFLGRDALITFHYVQEIPPKKSGKRPYVIQNYKRELT
ncbi:hypothetical protein QWY16_15105 [Planococcus shenhongbingii]|uniref:phenylacetate--CoA ligase family protein n=1 Tax=Planococcus shenhongbingii TaxID=3058398 RepID=UPI00260C7477|nr:hypothetical protein [Planococcus sp. N016]WKA57811.1 hypothetical protein QWY16_15105 [Planococcus sp. N016]